MTGANTFLINQLIKFIVDKRHYNSNVFHHTHKHTNIAESDERSPTEYCHKHCKSRGSESMWTCLFAFFVMVKGILSSHVSLLAAKLIFQLIN